MRIKSKQFSIGFNAEVFEREERIFFESRNQRRALDHKVAGDSLKMHERIVFYNVFAIVLSLKLRSSSATASAASSVRGKVNFLKTIPATTNPKVIGTNQLNRRESLARERKRGEQEGEREGNETTTGAERREFM